ncbi:MAG TPA: EamA family transporter [Candidatus Dormibacteraeota bacterium]|nr:EamA family transporter [Candidatus Dormibacteraeota bacterium]
MIPLAIALALASAALHGTWNVLVKVSGDPTNTLTRATAAAAVLLTPPAFVVWLVAGRPGLSPAAAGLAVVSAALELAYIFLLSAAYRRGEVSVVYPIARGSAPLLSVLAGLGLLGERLATPQLVGVALLLIGILAVTLPRTSGKATVPALLTGVAIAAYTSVDRVGVRLAAPWLYGWLLVVLLALGLVVAGSVRARLARRSEAGLPAAAHPITWRQASVIGLFMWVAYLLVLLALSIAPLAVVAPVRETAVVAVAVWGVWRLRERQAAALKLSGAFATLAGVALLAA